MLPILDLEELGRRRFRRLIGMAAAFVTTPTSMVNRLTGAETWTDAVNFGSPSHTWGGTQAFPAGSTIGGIVPSGVSGNAPVNVTGATLTLAPATHAGRVVTINRATGVAITPPAATGTGDVYSIYVGTTMSGGNTTLDAKAGAAADVFKGWLQTYKATTFTPYIANSNLNLLTLDGSTMGGIAGDFFQIRDVATNVWVITGFLTQSGTIATPLTNH